MSNMAVIKETEVLGRMFKVYGTVEEPLFLAKDIAERIGHSNVGKMVSDAELEDDEFRKENIEITYSYGNEVRTRNQEVLMLTENGLYEVLMQSRKPIAKQFKKEIKKILKALRLNQVELVNITNETKIDDTINNLMNMINTLIEDNKKKDIMLEKMVNHILENDKTKVKAEIKEIKTDNIEEEILNLTEDFMSVKEFCKFINSKGVIPKKIGNHIIHQLFRDNNILNSNNIPTDLAQGYFIDTNETTQLILTKQGMIETYRLAKKDITNAFYQLRR